MIRSSYQLIAAQIIDVPQVTQLVHSDSHPDSSFDISTDALADAILPAPIGQPSVISEAGFAVPPTLLSTLGACRWTTQAHVCQSSQLKWTHRAWRRARSGSTMCHLLIVRDLADYLESAVPLAITARSRFPAARPIPSNTPSTVTLRSRAPRSRVAASCIIDASSILSGHSVLQPSAFRSLSSCTTRLELSNFNLKL